MAADQAPEPFRLLFVCTGNTCRSPLAEAIARRSLDERGWTHVEVRSVGVGAMDGSPASSGALRAGERHGLDLTGHESARATTENLAWADLVLTMSPHHLHTALELGGEDRTTVLTSFAAGQDPAGIPDAVIDPFGGSDEVYEATFQLLDRLVHLTLERLAPVVAP